MTREMTEQVRALTLDGKGQNEIAALLAVHRNSVYRARQKMGLSLPKHGRRKPELTAAQEAEVLALLKNGKGTSWIGKHLGIGEYQVRLIVEKFKFRRGRGESGYRYRVSTAKRDKIIAEIVGRRNFCRTIAFKYKVSDKYVRQLAHLLLGCPEFRSGHGEPLTSNFPQKHATA